jgi:hemin uptake protein HemP
VNEHKTAASHGDHHANGSFKADSDRNVLCERRDAAAPNFDVHPVVSFSEIAGGTTEVIIEHEGQKYRLRATRNGRLLLNK